MAITYGFYNSVNHDRTYSATDFANIFNGIINDGVFMSIGTHMSVVPSTGMTIAVGPGRAWFNGTWTLNDSNYLINIDKAEVVQSRIDAVVLEIDKRTNYRRNTIKILKGTPSSSPVRPTLTKSSIDQIYQYALAYISVPANLTAINASHITQNVGMSDCPFVTAILQTANLDSLYATWNEEFTLWFNELQTTMSGDVAANLQSQINSIILQMKALNWDVNSATASEIGFPDAKTIADILKKFKTHMADLRSEIFTSDGEWFKPANFISGEVFVFGAGGGGVVGGGGGGDMSKGTYTNSTLTVDRVPITVGRGGEAGMSGGASSFGNYLSATGGGAGGNASSPRGGSGGTGGGGGGLFGGAGGTGTYGGGGGGGGGYDGGAGGNGGTYGGGGGGGGALIDSSTSGTSRRGGAGGNGGTYGGGGGGGGSRDYKTSGGYKGTHGGDGGSSITMYTSNFSSAESGQRGEEISPINDGRFVSQSTGANGGSGGSCANGGTTSAMASGGGGGGGGYGGNGGSGGKAGYYAVSSSNYCGVGGGGGGGGGYGGNGGAGRSVNSSIQGHPSPGGGGGGGGYCSYGGRAGSGGGGGGGYGGHGGDGAPPSSDDTMCGGGGGGGYGRGGDGGSSKSGGAKSGNWGAGGGGGYIIPKDDSSYNILPGAPGGDGLVIIIYKTGIA